ncbi:hypothetical protein [Halobacteriovorax sp. HLS]|uniref:hypothetical protein n=1 Tax=Halobacteriovorax sp. HLS TaxID=2234000 RepID=UPI000FD968D1|nr:hypothetical protein [Halobacteriovorax sp. HLS]
MRRNILVLITVLMSFTSCINEELHLSKYKTRGAAILVPVKFKNRPVTFLQLDTGSARSHLKLCKNELSRVSNDSNNDSQTHSIEVLGQKLEHKFHLYNYPKKFDCNKVWSKEPIGTIGNDILKDKLLVIDFIQSKAVIVDDESLIKAKYKQNIVYVESKVISNRFIVNVNTLSGKKLPLMYDTGGGEATITVEYPTWQELTGKSLDDSTNILTRGWSWNQYVDFVSNYSKVDIYLGPMKIKNPLIMFANSDAKNFKFSKYKVNISGILSNKAFEGDYILVLDFKNHKLGMLDPSME